MAERLPIIQQMLDARDDRARADVLLRCPDSIMLKYAPVFRQACQATGFIAGEAFVEQRVACMLAVRGAAGGLPGRVALELETLRAELAAYAAGAEIQRAAERPPPLDI